MRRFVSQDDEAVIVNGASGDDSSAGTVFDDRRARDDDRDHGERRCSHDGDVGGGRYLDGHVPACWSRR